MSGFHRICAAHPSAEQSAASPRRPSSTSRPSSTPDWCRCHNIRGPRPCTPPPPRVVSALELSALESVPAWGESHPPRSRSGAPRRHATNPQCASPSRSRRGRRSIPAASSSAGYSTRDSPSRGSSTPGTSRTLERIRRHINGRAIVVLDPPRLLPRQVVGIDALNVDHAGGLERVVTGKPPAAGRLRRALPDPRDLGARGIIEIELPYTELLRLT